MSDEPKQPSVESIIAESRAVCEAATDVYGAPSRCEGNSYPVSHSIIFDKCEVGRGRIKTWGANHRADAEFDIHARTMLPHCLEALEYAKSALGEMYKELQDAGGGGCDDAHKYHPTAKHAWCPGCHVERMTTILSGKGGDDV